MQKLSFGDIRVDDGGKNELVLSHYIRIKIFTERGREKQSKIEIPFLSGTKIKDVGARTLIYNRSFSFGSQSILLFPPETYADMKRLFDEVNKSGNHTIALKQGASAN